MKNTVFILVTTMQVYLLIACMGPSHTRLAVIFNGFKTNPGVTPEFPPVLYGFQPLNETKTVKDRRKFECYTRIVKV